MNLRSLLTKIGALEVPTNFDHAAADEATETRLREIYRVNNNAAPLPQPGGSKNTTLVRGSRRRGAPRARWIPAFVAMSALVLVVATTLTIVSNQDHPAAAQLHLTATRGPVTLVREGKTIPATDDLALANGTVIRIGPGGQATIGGQVLQAGTVAHVVDNRLVIDTEPSPTTARVPDGSTTAPSTTNTTRQTSPTTVASPDTTTHSTETSQTTFTEPAPSPVTIRARLVQSGRQLTIEWAFQGGANVGGIIVIGNAQGTDPQYPVVAGTGTNQMFSTTSWSVQSTTVQWVGGARLRVVVLDRNRVLLAQSAVLIAPVR